MFKKIAKFFNTRKKDEGLKINAPSRSSSPSPSLSSPGYTYNMFSSLFDGEKYPGGLNDKLDFFYIDYWALRRRSYRLFTENRYAKGLIQRLITNVIHKGLTLEATPSGAILGLDSDFINDWTDDVEEKFDIWADNEELVSFNHQFKFGEVQENIYKASLLSGDCLIILRQHPVLRTPTIEVLDGSHVRTPLDYSGKNEIRHGVELDSKGRQVAYHVQDQSSTLGLKSIRIPAKGPKSGRKIAWMVYGSKIRIDDVRGMPALGVLLQGLKELDRYSDAEQRAAVLNAVLALFITNKEGKVGSKTWGSSATRKDSVEVESSGEKVPRKWNINQHVPGVTMDQLQHGEEPVSFQAMRPNINYGAFEDAMIASFAWVLEIPPTIAKLAFTKSFSASGAEVSELRMFLDKKRSELAAHGPKPIYKEWLISMVLLDLIQAPGLLEAWRNVNQFLISGAWFLSEWAGAIKPSLKRNEDIKSWVLAISEGLATRDMATKSVFGRKYTTIVKRLIKENETYAEAIKPLQNAGLVKVENSSNTESEGNE